MVGLAIASGCIEDVYPKHLAHIATRPRHRHRGRRPTHAVRMVVGSPASPVAVRRASGKDIPKAAAPLPVGWGSTVLVPVLQY